MSFLILQKPDSFIMSYPPSTSEDVPIAQQSKISKDPPPPETILVSPQSLRDEPPTSIPVKESATTNDNIENGSQMDQYPSHTVDKVILSSKGGTSTISETAHKTKTDQPEVNTLPESRFRHVNTGEDLGTE